MSNRSVFTKIKDFFGFDFPSLEISAEREDEIVEKIVEACSNYGFVFPSQLAFRFLFPVSTIFVQTTVIPMIPFLEFFGVKASEYAAFLNKRSNVQRIMNRLEELRDEKDAKRTSFWDPGL